MFGVGDGLAGGFEEIGDGGFVGLEELACSFVGLGVESVGDGAFLVETVSCESGAPGGFCFL